MIQFFSWSFFFLFGRKMTKGEDVKAWKKIVLICVGKMKDLFLYFGMSIFFLILSPDFIDIKMDWLISEECRISIRLPISYHVPLDLFHWQLTQTFFSKGCDDNWGEDPAKGIWTNDARAVKNREKILKESKKNNGFALI